MEVLIFENLLCSLFVSITVTQSLQQEVLQTFNPVLHHKEQQQECLLSQTTPLKTSSNFRTSELATGFKKQVLLIMPKSSAFFLCVLCLNFKGQDVPHYCSFRVHFSWKCCCNFTVTYLIQTAEILLNSSPNTASLHYKFIKLYTRIRLFLSSFLNIDQIYTKTATIYTHKAIFETKQNVLLAKRSRNTDFLPYFWCSHSVLVLARAFQAKHLINKWRLISASKLLQQEAPSSSCSEEGTAGIQ